MKVELLFVTPQAEKLIETAGRTAYLSHEKQAESTAERFIKMLLSKGHHSVFEHAYATFRISGVSRAFTHQFVRHRLCSFTQQSQRFVSEANFTYIEPESVKKNPEAHAIFVNLMAEAKEAYLALQKLGIKNEDARFVLPSSIESQLVVTANLREWRHIIKLRGSRSAQWEIRAVVLEILSFLKQHTPAVFADLVINPATLTVEKSVDFQ
ncbi:MAG TPA: FAD-dependent thymidylate synthase [Desulfotomaculum sp.]|nr:FAD-dependent thymidylate synthase [Desulfotomaculum sp.]